MSAAAAERLVVARTALVGIDSLGVDDVSGKERPVHTVKVGGLGSFPVRAFGRVDAFGK